MQIPSSKTTRRTFDELEVGDLILLVGCDVVSCACSMTAWARKMGSDRAQELLAGKVRAVSGYYLGQTLKYADYVSWCWQCGREPAILALPAEPT